MSYMKLLFSFKGRIPRSVYWLKFILPFTILSWVLQFVDISLGTMLVVDPNAGDAGRIGYISLAFGILIIYPSLAVMAKRCHDRGRSGWFLLVLLVPIVQIWPMIVVAFLKGTSGPNKYGEDPLQQNTN